MWNLQMKAISRSSTSSVPPGRPLNTLDTTTVLNVSSLQMSFRLLNICAALFCPVTIHIVSIS